jgi:hypothetical protein
MNTRDYAQKAKAEGYDGVIFKNIHDNGGYSNGSEGASTVAIAFESNQIKSVANENPTGDADIRYSLSDNKGRELSAEQVEYFRESKVVDENGNLKVMYHGTPSGKFTVFKDGTYFTENKWYADLYQNPGASSISTGKVANAPKTYEVYLDIKKPFDINDAEARKIYINDYIKGGNAVGINPYLSDAEYAKIRSIDWTEGEDLRDFLIDNGYDYDGLVLDEGAVGGYGDDVKYRGKSYVIFNPEQVKNVDNKTPTDNPDIRFSLSETVEETNDLMALHNLTSEKLLKSLKLGGLPMPSVAIAKAQDGHGEFGEITLVLNKDAIDPQTSSKNKLYSGDAWTPTYPSVEYKPSQNVLWKVDDKISTLVPYEIQKELGSLMFDMDNARDFLNRYNGNIVEAYKRNDAMKYAYLKDTGSDVTLPMKEDDLYLYGGVSNAAVRYFSGKLVDGLQTVKMYRNMSASDLLNDNALTEAIADAQNFDVLRTLKPGTNEHSQYKQNPMFRADEVAFRDIDNFLDAAKKLFTKGIQQKVDRKAAKEIISSAVDQTAYENWLEKLFDGVVEKEGIRNNKDYYTPSGNRRSFEALHYEHNLENVIKAMREKGEKGIGNGFGGASIFGASTTEFSSIEDMKRSDDRLQKMSYDEYQELRKGFTDRFLDIAISLPNEKNSFMATDSAAEVMTEAVAKYKTKSGIANYLKKELKGWATYSEQAVDDLIELVNDIRQMPTRYFEAKPQRAVGFDEVAVFVIPRNADVKLKQELLNRGYSIAEYDPDIEGDRQKVVNSFEEYKFSLSNVGETPKKYGNFNFYGKDLKFAPTEDIAPIQETVSKTETVDDYAPMPSEPNAYELEQKKYSIAVQMADANAKGDIKTRDALLAEFNSLKDRIAQESAKESAQTREYLNSITDEDAPPETDIVYPETYEYTDEDYERLGNKETYSETLENLPDDPLADRNIEDMGDRKVKAYQYENPEVKPFFQQEAEVMLNELLSGLKGKRYTIDDGSLHPEWTGQKRVTSDEIAYLLDNYYTYDQIEKGLRAIIADDGAENNACSKRIEFMLNDRLLKGYRDMWTKAYNPPNQDYVNLLRQKEITAYNDESFKHFFENADDYAPPIDEDNAPIRKTATEEKYTPKYKVTPNKDVFETDDIAPIASEAIKPKIEKNARAEKSTTRQQLHKTIVDGLKAKFADKGFDFDKVLKGAKNLSTFATVDNIPQRVMEKSLGYKEGQILADETVNKVAQNETAGIKWLNSFTNRKDGVLAQISKRYNIKPGSKESAAAQMYAEGFYVNENNDLVEYGEAELRADFPDARVRNNIKMLATDPRIRRIYDETLASINESRARNAYPEIPRLDNYFLHFRAMEDTFSRLGLPFNPNDIRAKDLPTDLNGVTADLKPGQPFFASAMHRKGNRTTYDLLGGLERYLTSAKNQIYHIDDIQTLRALRNYIADNYGQAKGLESLDALTEEEAQERIKQVYGSHLSTFAKFLNEEANILAGKTALIDRGLEGIIGRRGITFLDTVNKQVGSNMVGFNVSSSLTNFLAGVQAIAKTNKLACVKSLAQTTAGKVGSIFGKTDSFVENNPTIIRRKGADRFYRTPFQKVGDAGYVLMSAVDDITTEFIVRAKYNEFIQKGMSEQRAVIEADKWTSRLMGDRSLGQMPQLYNSKMLGLVTKFQLEVRNQLDSQFYDTIQEAKVSNEDIENGFARNAKTAAKVTATFFELAVLQHLFGKAFESVAGYNPAFDIIDVLIKTFGLDDDEEDEDTALDNIEEGFLTLLEDLPYTSTLTGGRIPISSALPLAELVKGEDEYGNEKSRLETLGEIAPYYILPSGYGQIKKTAQGLYMFDDDLPIAGSYTDSGNLRFPIDDTLANRVQAGLFGQWANENARDYFDNERKPLNEKQTQEFIDVDIPIRDYWEYREGLSGLDKMSEKADYINNLDLPISKKNLLLNNIANRKEDLDMTDYDDYGSFEEFDFAQKNPEKYSFFQNNGISYKDYATADEDGKNAYTWAYNNPEKFTLSKAIASDVVTYRKYTSELYDIKADKDENGKSISGSRKEKVIDYINNLDADYGEKIILFKSEYNADDTYNYEIIEYLNSREDISFKEMETILKELGFTVLPDGTVQWD